MTNVTIYHNPRCGTSRKTLQFIRDAGIEPTIILYLETPPSAKELKDILKKLGLSARELMRAKEATYKELNLEDPKWTDSQLVEFMAEHPILIQRPIVLAPDGARLCRPAEVLFEILPEARA